jgi:AraC family ethanolamine operon transcriptional activator
MPLDRAATEVAAVVLHTKEHDEFAQALLGGTFEYLPVGRDFDASLRLLTLGSTMVQHAVDGPHITRGAIGPGLCALILPLAYRAETPRINGREVAAVEGFFAPGGADLFVHAPGTQAWAALAMPTSQIERWSEFGGPRSMRRDARALSLAPGPAGRLAQALSHAGRLAEEPGPLLSQPGCGEALGLALQDMVIDVLADGAAELPRPRATREAHRVVRGAEEFLRADPDRPIQREELCTALGVSLRKLHDAFVGTTGMSPQYYLKLRRLVMVRRLLHAPSNDPPLVKSAALSHGFWHLGHFARDYRELFGETPSETAARRRPRAA